MMESRSLSHSQQSACSPQKAEVKDEEIQEATQIIHLVDDMKDLTIKENDSQAIVLPREITDEVIYHLYDDDNALAVCSLVCHDWIAPSRYHLFDAIYASVMQIPKLYRFIGLLEHPLCTFALSIRKLIIYAYALGCPEDDQQIDNDSLVKKGWFDPLLPHLNKLVSVKFFYSWGMTDWHIKDSWKKLLSMTSFNKQIRFISLYEITFDSFQPFIETILSFPNIFGLQFDLKYDNWNEAPESSSESITSLLPAQGPVPLPNLRTIELCDLDYWMCHQWCLLLWTWLLKANIRISKLLLPSVVLDADTVKTSHFAPFARYIQFLGPSLSHLQLSFYNCSQITYFLRNVDLTVCTGLRHLELETIRIAGMNTNTTLHMAEGSPNIVDLLSQIRSPDKLMTLRIGISSNVGPNVSHSVNGSPESNEAWTALDNMLVGPSFSALKKIIFIYYNFGAYDVMAQLIKILPHCQAKGVLFAENGDVED